MELKGININNSNENIKPLKLPDELSKPNILDKRFLRPNSFKQKLAKILLGNEIYENNLKENLLLLIKNNGFVEIIQNVQSGEFIIQTSSGEKSIMLSPNKIQTLKYGKQFIRCWIAYEDSATTYPEDPIHTADMQRKITQKLAMNWKDRDERSNMLIAKGKFWLYIIGAIALAIVLIMSVPGAKDIFLGSKEEVVTTVVNNATALASAIPI